MQTAVALDELLQWSTVDAEPLRITVPDAVDTTKMGALAAWSAAHKPLSWEGVKMPTYFGIVKVTVALPNALNELIKQDTPCRRCGHVWPARALTKQQLDNRMMACGTVRKRQVSRAVETGPVCAESRLWQSVWP